MATREQAYIVMNGTWADGSTANIYEQVEVGTIPQNIPTGMIPNPGFYGGYWSPDPYQPMPSTRRASTYSFRRAYKITYVVRNGTWADGTTEPIVSQVEQGGVPTDIPTGMEPDLGRGGGTWDPNPYNPVTQDNRTFYYSFNTIVPIRTITYNVVNGTWSDGTTEPKTEQVNDGRIPKRIPTGMIPNTGFDEGEWSRNPYGAIITNDTTFTFMFEKLPPGDDIPRMAQVNVYYRLKTTTPTRAGEQASEWIQKGEYYIDTRTTTSNDDNLNILEAQCFDSMLKTNAMYGSSSLTYPALDTDVVAEICTKLGFVQDSRNASVMTGGYTIPAKPTDMTMRDVLSYIGVMYAANWVFNDKGALRIIPLVNAGDVLYVDKSVQNITTSPKRKGYTKVSITVSDTEVIESGVSDDNVMEAVCPWMTQAIADNLYSILSQFRYRPCTASGVWSDPAVELGDTLVTHNTTSQIHAMDSDYGSVVFMDLSAPNDNYIEHEYAYYSPSSRSGKNTIRNMEERISVVVDEDGINGPAIIYAINYTGPASKINADKVDIQGFVKSTDLSTSGGSEINADNLIDGTIADQAGKNNWDLLTGRMETTDLHIDNESVNVHEEFIANTGSASKTAIATDEFSLYDKNGKLLGEIGADVSGDNAVNGYIDLRDTRNAPSGKDYIQRIHGDASGVVFYDENDNVTAQYPATGLSAQDLNGNESEVVAASGSTKTYTLGAGVYLIATAKMDDASAAQDGLFMASVGETGVSHISEILAPTGTTTVVLSGDTLTVTTGDANMQIVINKIG